MQPLPPSSLPPPGLSIIILSIQNPATSQSGPLWRNPCVGTLAGNYRVPQDYNVEYSPQEPHPAEQSQSTHAYDTHHRGSLGGPSSLHDPPDHHSHHSHHSHSHTSHHGLPQHHPSAHHHQVLMDPGHLGGHAAPRHLGHPGPSHYAPGPSPHSVVAPLYPSMVPTPGSTSAKRRRPSDLDLAIPGIPDLEHGELESMQQSQMGGAYGQAGGTVSTHHHHRMPDAAPPAKMMRRDSQGGGGGAPSVVGQAGMPPPAPRPRGPKLKFTPEDDQLLIDLKENKSLTWKQIADFFPGRSSGTLQVRYCTKLKAKTTQWTDETDQKLRTALQDYEREKWRIVASKVGTGFTPIACQERAAQILGTPL
ncbi:hypothetical protein RB596_003074 [Gaeumannomyces avenae]